MTSTDVLDAAGPEQIRTAFAAALDAAAGHTDDLTGLTRVLDTAADRYETLQMSASTLAHLRNAAIELATAAALARAGQQQLQAAADDFDARDGRVAAAVADTGNLMQAAGYTATFAPGNAGTAPSRPLLAPEAPVSREPATIKDPARVGTRLVLREGEAFAGSAATKGNDDGLMVLAAAVDTPTGRTVHVGVPLYEEEEKSRWKGAHAAATDTEVDEEDDTYTVDTGADRTVILDADAATQLPAQVEQAIAAATEADKQYRQLAKRSDRLYDQRAQLEARRFDDPADAEAQMRLDGREHQHRTYQPRRRAEVAACVDRLNPDDRARYDQIQARLDEAGLDTFEPGTEQLAADLCGLPLADFTELVDLRKKSYGEQTPAERQRCEQLSPAQLPPLLAEQAAIVYGLTVEQYRELEDLEKLGPVRPPHLRRYGGRTPQQQQRYEQLSTAPGGVTGATPAQTRRLRGQFETYQSAHYAGKFDGAAARRHRADLQARAKPLPEPDAEQLRQVITEHDQLSTRLDELGGATTARVQVPARHGAVLLIKAEQREEEGGVDYTVTTSQPTSNSETPVHEPYRTTAAGLRKVATMIAGLGRSV